MYVHRCIYIRTYTHMQTRIHTNTHTYKHIQTHIRIRIATDIGVTKRDLGVTKRDLGTHTNTHTHIRKAADLAYMDFHQVSKMCHQQDLHRALLFLYIQVLLDPKP